MSDITDNATINLWLDKTHTVSTYYNIYLLQVYI